MPYSVREKVDIFNIMAYLSVGDLGRAIAVYKFYDLSNAFNAAEYSLDEAKRQTNNIYKQFYLLKESIVGFNSCYDYPLQVIYFAFDFFEKVTSVEDYKKIIHAECKKGRTSFSDDIKKLKQCDDNARHFFEVFDRYSDFVSNQEYGIKQWANNIKHQGGFVAADILALDNVANVQCFQGEVVGFTSEWLYPYSPSIGEIIQRLEKQRDNLIQFMDWLFDSIFGNTEVIDFKPKEKMFSANKCIQNTQYSLIIPVRE